MVANDMTCAKPTRSWKVWKSISKPWLMPTCINLILVRTFELVVKTTDIDKCLMVNQLCPKCASSPQTHHKKMIQTPHDTYSCVRVVVTHHSLLHNYGQPWFWSNWCHVSDESSLMTHPDVSKCTWSVSWWCMHFKSSWCMYFRSGSCQHLMISLCSNTDCTNLGCRCQVRRWWFCAKAQHVCSQMSFVWSHTAFALLFWWVIRPL